MLPHEAGKNGADVGPEHATQCLAPTIGLAKEVEHLLLFFGSVAPARYFNLYLAVQRDGVDGLLCGHIFDMRRKAIVGDAANGSTLACSTLKLSSGMRLPR